MDSFLEIVSFLFMPYVSQLSQRNEFTELLFATCSRYIELSENSRLLPEIREPVWAYLRQHCPSFLARDCNACFSEIFEEKTFGELTPDEMSLFSSLRTFHSFCNTCKKDVTLNSSFLLNFVTRSALQKSGLDDISWPLYVSSIQTQPGKLSCPNCEKPTCEPVMTSVAHSQFLFIEFSPELMNGIHLYEIINVGKTDYQLKGMVRSFNRHFTCAVLIEGKWNYIDDLCSGVKQFSNLISLKQQFSQGWFFAIYELSSCKINNITNFSSCQRIATELDRSSQCENQPEFDQPESCKTDPIVTVNKEHFMNAVLNTSQVYSCAVDSFLEVVSFLILPHLSDLVVRNEFTELLFATCSRYIELSENSRLLPEIREPVWAYLRQHCPSFLARDCNACFSEIFEEKTFGELTPDEMSLFSSLRTFHSFCNTCKKDVTLNSSILLFCDQISIAKVWFG